MFVVIFFEYLMFNHSIALNCWIIKLMAFTAGLTYLHYNTVTEQRVAST